MVMMKTRRTEGAMTVMMVMNMMMMPMTVLMLMMMMMLTKINACAALCH